VLEWTGNETVAGLSEWVIDRPIRILFIIVLAWLFNRLMRRTIAALSDRIRSQPSHPRLRMLRGAGPGGSEINRSEANRAPARAEAIESVLKSFVTTIVSVVALLLILGEVDINLAPLLAGAGVVGIAIGFGAQSVVGDFLTGMFMLIEDQYGVGDVIEVDGVSGEVESISLRTTKLRDLAGTVWHVPNGSIRKVGNKSQLWSNAVVDMPVSRDADLRQAIELMNDVADAYWRETHGDDVQGDIIEDPVVLGVQRISAAGFDLRMLVKTDPSAQWRVERQLRLRLTEAFEAAEIALARPEHLVEVRNEAG